MNEDKTAALTAETPETTPAAPVKRGPGRPKGPRKLQAVAPASTEDVQRAKWNQLERTARAKRLGVPEETLAFNEKPVENWREKLPQGRPPADPAYAGLYRLTGGNVCTSSGEIAFHGTVIRLDAQDGEHITVRGIGVWVAP